MENVLIWPQQYPLLLKGLVEQNGAFILDALESWPACRTSLDTEGVLSSVLPPVYYLIWQQPREPFEECYFQHLYEYDEGAQQYVLAAIRHFNENGYGPEQLSQHLLAQLEGYADLTTQAAIESPLSLAKLLFEKRYFGVIEMLLAKGWKLAADDILMLWQEIDFRARFGAFLPDCAADLDALAETAAALVAKGEDYFTLLERVSPDSDSLQLLEQALLAHLQGEQAMQTMAMRFIEQGATGVLADGDGKTAYMWAAQKGYVNVLEALLDKQNPEARDHQGNSALHYAVLGKNVRCLSLLLKAGYDCRVKNRQGFSCYGLAVETRATNLIKCLERDFGIKELSLEGQYRRIFKVHALHALVALLLPLQLFFFFGDATDYKSELTLGFAVVSVVALFMAVSLKRCSLYPVIRHPVGLSVLRYTSVLSLLAQLGLVLVVALAFIAQMG